MQRCLAVLMLCFAGSCSLLGARDDSTTSADQVTREEWNGGLRYTGPHGAGVGSPGPAEQPGLFARHWRKLVVAAIATGAVAGGIIYHKSTAERAAAAGIGGVVVDTLKREWAVGVPVGSSPSGPLPVVPEAVAPETESVAPPAGATAAQFPTFTAEELQQRAVPNEIIPQLLVLQDNVVYLRNYDLLRESFGSIIPHLQTARLHARVLLQILQTSRRMRSLATSATMIEALQEMIAWSEAQERDWQAFFRHGE